MPVVRYFELKAKDLQDNKLTALNDILRQLAEAVNYVQGVNGSITLLSSLNLNGNPVTNIGAPTGPNDALNQTNADPMYSAASMQKTMEVVGNSMLQGSRRLNDPTQQDVTSSHLKVQGSIIPVACAALSFGTSSGQITWTPPSKIYYPDGSTQAIPASQAISVTGLSNGTTYYFYPYYNTVTNQFTLVIASTGVGSPAAAFSAPSPSLWQQMNIDGSIPLSTTAISGVCNGAVVTSGGRGIS